MLMGQWAKQFGFLAKPSQILFPTEVDHFDGDLAMQLVIRGQIDFCHSPPSQQVCEVVAAQCCSFQCWHSWLFLPPCIVSIVEDRANLVNGTAPGGGQKYIAQIPLRSTWFLLLPIR